MLPEARSRPSGSTPLWTEQAEVEETAANWAQAARGAARRRRCSEIATEFTTSA